MKTLLSVRNLTKVYPSGVKALDSVSLDVQEGEFLVVIGLSGSGKSTLHRCINRLVEPSSGDIVFDGHNMTNLSAKQLRQVRRRIAMIFQDFNLIPRLSVLNNVLAGRLGYNSTWRSILHRFTSKDIDLAHEYLRIVGLEERHSTRADQLSGGQQQRVAIARALCQIPSILLADEPVASLDPATSHTVMDYLRKANGELGVTVVCNLHFLSLVREYATRVIALRSGRLVFSGPPEDIDRDWFKKIYGEEARDIGN